MKTWQYGWQLFRFSWPILVPTILANMLLYGLLIVPGLVVRALFNGLTGDAPLQLGLWAMIALLTANAVVVQTLYCLFAVGRTTVGHTIAALLQRNLLARIFQLPGARALPYSTGEALSRFRDDVHQISGFCGTFYHFTGTVFIISILTVLLLRINPWVTAIVFIPLLIVTWLLQQSRSRLVRYREASQATTGNVTGALGEIFRVVQAIKLADATESVVAYTERLNNKRHRAALQDRIFTEVLNAVANNINDAGTGLILLLIGVSMQPDAVGIFSGGTFALTVGDFAFFVFALPWVGTLIGASTGLLTRYRQVGVSLERLVTLMQGVNETALVEHHPIYLRTEAPSLAEFADGYEDKADAFTTASAQPQSEILCEVRGLTYQHPETTDGIRSVSFQIPRGSFTVIMGRVGSGKTTLLRTLLGLLPKDAGEILWQNKAVADPATFFVPPRSAYTPQVPRLFSDPLRENILWGMGSVRAGSGGVRHNSVKEAIYAAVMERDMAEMAEGLATVVGPRGVRLSGGQVQRTAAARMFVRKPELLVFDDLSSALDVETEQLLWARLFARTHRDKANRPTCLVVSHRWTALERADQVVVLKDGRVKNVGTLVELLARCAETQHLLAVSQHEAKTG